MKGAGPAAFGPYQVVRELARGGMGVIYEVVDPATRGTYALKTLVAGVDSEVLLRFRREVEVLGRVDHPHVVKVHTARLDAHPPYLVQALLPGGTLQDRLRDGPLDPREAVQITCKLAAGLAAAHALGVLHRDLKPQNVLFDERGEPVLVDFGLARTTQVEPRRLTQTGAIMGTPSYMAPEQVNTPHQVGPEADVYGLAALLYTLLAGRPPFEGSLYGVLEQVLEEPPPPPSRLSPQVPPEVEAVVMGALAKDPSARPPSAEAFRAALLGGVRVPPSRRGPLAAAVAAVAVVVAVAAGWAAGAGREVDARDPRLVRADVRGALKDGDYARLAPLSSEVAALRAADAPGAGDLGEQLSLLAGLDALNRRDPRAARARLAELGEERRAILEALLEALDPAVPVEAAVDLVRGVRVRVPERDLWVARIHGRALDREGQARACQDAFERYARSGRPLGPADAELRAACAQAVAWHSSLRRLGTDLDVADASFRQRLAKRADPEDPAGVALQVRREVLDELEEGLPAGSPGADLRGVAEAAAARLLERAARGIPDLTIKRPSAADHERCQRLLALARRVWPDLRLSHAELDPFLRFFSAPFDQERWEPAARLGEELFALGGSDRQVLRELGTLADRFWAPEATRRMLPICRRFLDAVNDAEERQGARRVLATALLRVGGAEHLDEVLELTGAALEDGVENQLLRCQLRELRAQVFKERGLDERELVELDAAVGLAGARAVPYAMRAELHALAGRSAQAADDARRFLSLGGEESLPEHGVAVAILWEHAREERALLEAQIGRLVKQRRYPGWRARRALVLVELGRTEEALDELEKAVAYMRDPARRASMIVQLRNLTPSFERSLEQLRAGSDDARAPLVDLVNALDRVRRWCADKNVGVNP